MIISGACVLASLLPHAHAAPSTGPVDAVEDITLHETDDSVYAIVWTIAGVLVGSSCLLLLVLICWRNAKRRQELEEEASLNNDLKEWYYVQGQEVLGPFSAYSMRVHFRLHDIDRSTLCKLVWQSDFVPVSQLFPDSGTEFNMEPKLSDDDAHTDWHRHSVLARPSGKPPPAISWFYSLDGQVYGPFEMGKMRHWYMVDYFAADTLVRIGSPQGPFKPVKDFYPDLERAFDGVPLIPEEGMSLEAPSDMGRGSFYTPGTGSGLAFPPAASQQVAPQTVGRPGGTEEQATAESTLAQSRKKKKKAREGEESGEAAKKKKGTKKKKPREDGTAPEEVSAGND